MHDDDCCTSADAAEIIHADPANSTPRIGDTPLAMTRSALVKGAVCPDIRERFTGNPTLGGLYPRAREAGVIVSASLRAQYYEFGPFRLYVTERLLLNGDEPVALGGRAFDMLMTLIERRGEIVDPREFRNRIWPDVMVEASNIRVQVSTLRKALGDGQDGARYIVNVPGRGYCFVARIKCTPRQFDWKTSTIRQNIRGRTP